MRQKTHRLFQFVRIGRLLTRQTSTGTDCLLIKACHKKQITVGTMGYEWVNQPISLPLAMSLLSYQTNRTFLGHKQARRNIAVLRPEMFFVRRHRKAQKGILRLFSSIRCIDAKMNDLCLVNCKRVVISKWVRASGWFTSHLTGASTCYSFYISNCVFPIDGKSFDFRLHCIWQNNENWSIYALKICSRISAHQCNWDGR